MLKCRAWPKAAQGDGRPGDGKRDATHARRGTIPPLPARTLPASLACSLMFSVALAACGSSTTTTTNTAASESPSLAKGSRSPAIESYVGGVASICATAASKLHSEPPFPYPNFDPTHPDKSALPKVGQYFARTSLPVYESAVTKLKALPEPAATRQAAESLKRDLTAYTSNLQAQIRSAEAVNSPAFVTTVNTFKPIGDHLMTDFQALGATSCNSLLSGG